MSVGTLQRLGGSVEGVRQFFRWRERLSWFHPANEIAWYELRSRRRTERDDHEDAGKCPTDPQTVNGGSSHDR